MITKTIEKLRRMPERTRAYVYRVSVAGIGVGVAFGVLTDTKAASLVVLVGALFPTALAAANTSTEIEEG